MLESNYYSYTRISYAFSRVPGLSPVRPRGPRCPRVPGGPMCIPNQKAETSAIQSKAFFLHKQAKL